MGSVGDYWREAADDARRTEERRHYKALGYVKRRRQCACGRGWPEWMPKEVPNPPVQCKKCKRKAKREEACRGKA